MYYVNFFIYYLLDNLNLKNNYLKIKFCNKSLIVDKKKTMQIFIPSILIIILLTFRHDYVGTDTQNYRILYDNFSLQYFDTYKFTFNFSDIVEILNGELGFYLLIYISKFFGLSFRVFKFIQALLIVFCIGKLTNKYSKNIILSYFVYFTFGFFIFSTTQRQCFAMIFTIFAFMYAKECNLKRFFLWSTIACLFHTSAIVFFSCYFLIKIEPSKKLISLFLCLFFLVYFFRDPIMSNILSLLQNSNYEEKWTSGWSTIVVLLPLFISPLFTKNSCFKNDTVWSMIAFAFILFPFSQFNPFFSRLIKYFQIYYIIYIPNMLYDFKDKYRFFLKSIIIIFGLINFFIFTNLSGVRQIPYIFNNQSYPESDKTVGLLPFGFD